MLIDGSFLLIFFFFQAEDGIRALYVTGVQTCALPICRPRPLRDRGSAPRLAGIAPGEAPRIALSCNAQRCPIELMKNPRSPMHAFAQSLTRIPHPQREGLGADLSGPTVVRELRWLRGRSRDFLGS